MALQSAVAIAMLAAGLGVGAVLVQEYQRRDAQVTREVLAQRAEAAEERRGTQRAERDRVRAERDRRHAALERCMKDRKRAWERARRADGWKRPREPRSCRRIES